MADQAGAVGEAAAYCVRLLRRYDPDRLATLTFVPPPRAALLALYAFNADIARLRDAVREPLVRELRLKWWREAVAGAAAQRVQPKPEVRLLREGLAQGRLAESAMQRLIDGWSRDFAAAADTLADAERRGGDTAGLLLEAVLGALGVSEPAAQAAAHHIGTAWALLELVRAVPSDARLGRCRLPLDLLRDHGLSAAAVAAGTRGRQLAAVAEVIDRRAAEHLRAARRLRPQVPRAAVPALLSGAIADSLRRRLARAAFDPYCAAPTMTRLARQLGLARYAWSGRY